MSCIKTLTLEGSPVARRYFCLRAFVPFAEPIDAGEHGGFGLDQHYRPSQFEINRNVDFAINYLYNVNDGLGGSSNPYLYQGGSMGYINFWPYYLAHLADSVTYPAELVYANALDKFYTPFTPIHKVGMATIGRYSLVVDPGPMSWFTGGGFTGNMYLLGGSLQRTETPFKISAGYGLVHFKRQWNFPVSGSTSDVSMPSWYVFVQRYIYTFVSQINYNVYTYSGKFQKGRYALSGGGDVGSFLTDPHNQFYGDFPSEVPMDMESLLNTGPNLVGHPGDLIDVPFPNPAVYGYPVILPDDPSSEFIPTTGVLNCLAPYQENFWYSFNNEQLPWWPLYGT